MAEIKLAGDRRDGLVAERTRAQNRLSWHLHDLWPELAAPAGGLGRRKWLERLPLLELPGCGTLTAAKLIAETAGAERFASEAKFAWLAGVAPIPAASGNRAFLVLPSARLRSR